MKDKGLKTLKDIENEKWISKNDLGYIQAKKDLKQEAIKWVKEMNKLETADDMIYEKNWEEIFKHFFNLTEKDLKNEK